MHKKYQQLIKLLPQTLLWRTLSLFALIICLNTLTAHSLFYFYESEPRSQQLANLIVSFATLSRDAISQTEPSLRQQRLTELSALKGILIVPANANNTLVPLESTRLTQDAMRFVQQEFDPRTSFAQAYNQIPGFWLNFFVDNTEYWLKLPNNRFNLDTTDELISIAMVVALLALLGTYVVVNKLNQPLKRFANIANTIERGDIPKTIPEEGPSEFVVVSGALNRMINSLQQQTADREIILAGISHDLRTPLARLCLSVEISHDTLNPQLRDGINADIQEMDNILKQFLDYARGTAHEQVEATDLPIIFREQIAQYASLDQSVSLQAPQQLIADIRPQAMKRVFANLLENAQKYGRAPIKACLAQHGKYFVCTIWDHGPGIPIEEIPRILKPFERLNTSRTGASGTGLGLSIVKRIIDEHHGDLTFIHDATTGFGVKITVPLHTLSPIRHKT